MAPRGSWRTSWRACAMLASLAILVGVSGVVAHEGDGSATVTPAQAGPGESVTVVGTSFTPGSEVAIAIVSGNGMVQLGSATADREGGLVAQVTIPADMPPRYYELHAVDATGFELVGYLEVTGSATATGPSVDEAPGWGWVAVVGGLTLTGTVLVAVGRRRLRRVD